MTAVTIPAKVARNLTRSFFEMAHKRCNSNGLISKFEISGGELRATFLGNRVCEAWAGKGSVRGWWVPPQKLHVISVESVFNLPINVEIPTVRFQSLKE